jgi:serine kinase of HPr protein (carbohydrate metabolism regulator)
MTLLHATCVAIDGAGVLIRGASGAGKSDLALRLIDGGAALVGDDYCDVTARDGMLIAQVRANLSGKMEVRGYGIATLPAVPSTRVALVVDLAPVEDIPRLPDVITCTIDGVTLPWLLVDPVTASAAAKVRLAVRQLNMTTASRTGAA